MSCNPELVSAFIDGELESVIVGSVTNHLLKCDDCCRTMGKLAMIQGAVSEKFALCHPEDLTQSVMQAISNEKMSPPQNRLHKRLVRFGVPALLVTSLLSAPGISTDAEAADSLKLDVVYSMEEGDSERS
jgi:anti-sigma factor RsiW